MGIGSDNVYLIKTDAAGKMDASHLGKSTRSEILCKIQQ